MPRTRTTRKKKVSTKRSSSDTHKLSMALKNSEIFRDSCIDRIDVLMANLISRYTNIFAKEQSMSIPSSFQNKTLKELKALSNADWLSTVTGVSSFFNATQNSTKQRTLRRSVSLIDDEGYLTAESSSGTSGPVRRSRRAANKTVNSTRVSRSLSRTNLQKTRRNSYKTPANKMPPPSYGTVTPKVKPNTPQVLLRRPMQGEMVLSLQGSPLFTGSVVNETIANVNIPLQDGRLLSIQPQRGLRMSQIPALDADTKRQLETLRDNLNKVCALSGMKTLN